MAGEAQQACKGRGGLEKNANSDRHLGELLCLSVDPVGTGPSLCPFWLCQFRGREGPYPGTAHTQEEKAARALGAGGAGELGLETRPAPGVGCAACPFKQEAFDKSTRQRPQLPWSGTHLFPNIHDSKEPWINFRPVSGEGWGATSSESLTLAHRVSPLHWPQLGRGAEHRTDTFSPPGAQTVSVLLPELTLSTPWAPQNPRNSVHRETKPAPNTVSHATWENWNS